VELVEKGKKEGVKIVVDNLQSGPDAGRSIAETIRAKHVVLTNFPSENGYLATLGKNAEAIIDAAMKR
jgi:zinc transport system substrate-binding protein